MAQAQVDEWCAEAAKTHYMPVSDTQYAAVPREARGVPHQTIPGLHAYWTTTPTPWSARARSSDIEDRRTVDSLQCLPLSPFAERQAPHVAEGSGDSAASNHRPTPLRTDARPLHACADPTVPKRFRNPDDAVGAEGRAFQVDATCADVAILREPLVPCVAITSPQDCIFGQSQPFLTSVLGAAAALVAARALRPYLVGAPRLPRTASPSRRCTCCTCCSSASTMATRRHRTGCRTTGRATAAVLLNSIFTCGHEMAERVIVRGNAQAPAACAARMRAQAAAASAHRRAAQGPRGRRASCAEAQEWWAPFARRRRT